MLTSETALQARGLHFSFGQQTVLTDVDVDLTWGTVTAIAGANGAGKSTLLELLAGVRKPASGSVDRADEVALVVQRIAAPDTLPLTVADAVAMGTWGTRKRGRVTLSRSDRRARIAEALERVRLADLANRPFTELSGGQRQRALIAQGLARQARIFLLDEPATGLDAESRDRTRTILQAEADRGAAVVCVSHDPEAIAAADAVVMLGGGRRVD
ncbi:putative ABC transporter ATP-binding protein [Arthrobacter ulcerisalmonis]|uniref:Putative ABC transporter ATP-binding protein n=1 Tax=Arthrobacter ulcerisalmonis TaxID=2483813 RepID=A0A3P5XAI4_9MICC|nr:zinc ABC transporter ATP-binding protein AztA [Arthrobacter ulcerisalmonis]VDC25477.1 putative ABC transporter ATP-binding protein [Arthrobacter ulcerisalmonis]